jgi:putative ABC transport system permease protein
LKSSLEDIWGPLPADRLVALKDFWSAGLLPYTGQAKLVGVLALFAIPLAVVGVASFMLFVVRSEHRAMAIRLAVGAEPRQVMEEVLARGAVAVATGVGIGVAVGIGLGRILSARLLGVDALDPVSLAITVVSFGFMGVAATWTPALIASRANPSVLLREVAD